MKRALIVTEIILPDREAEKLWLDELRKNEMPKGIVKKIGKQCSKPITAVDYDAGKYEGINFSIDQRRRCSILVREDKPRIEVVR